jgi:Coenzyme PQQ synthesis protein D (PqqD)
METRTSTIKVRDSIRETINADGAVLLDIDQGICLSINSVGTRIWRMIKEGHPLDEIAESLLQEYEVSREVIMQDISDFVRQLEANHLVDDGKPSRGNSGVLARLFRNWRPGRNPQ